MSSTDIPPNYDGLARMCPELAFSGEPKSLNEVAFSDDHEWLRTGNAALITRRSEVQILPPPPRERVQRVVTVTWQRLVAAFYRVFHRGESWERSSSTVSPQR